MENNINIRPNQLIGLNLDSTESYRKPGMTTFVLNGQVSNFDGQEYTIQNEQANELCATLPQGFRVVGVYNITQMDRILFFLTNISDSTHQIGYIEGKSCQYTKLIEGECLNFSVDHPIHQVVVKNTNCGISVYWTDGNMSMRHFSFEDLPWKEVPNPDNDYQNIKLEGQLDCNKLLVQPKFGVPQTEIMSVEEGGRIITGTYQFVTQYANSLGESYTSFYNVTNPISINQTERTTPDFDLATSKAIRVKVTGLDTSGVFDYFNLVVVETINGISTPKLVGTYPITSEEYDILYTGDTSTAIQLTPEQLFQRFQYYNVAKGVTQSDDRIIWYGLKEAKKVNYQPIVSQFKLYWETYKIPYTIDEGYYNPMNTLLYKGYMRDEVYPIEFCFLLRGGRQTDSFVAVGRLPNGTDRNIISNTDARSVVEGRCETSISKERWEVYNTGSVIAHSPEYVSGGNDSCYKGPYQFGEFAYWESEEKYPNNPNIWGSLANAPIRHFKFPDELVTPRFSVDDQGNEFIYPIGIKVDANSVYQAIQTSDLTPEQKSEIIGFKVSRGNRLAGNMSVKAKGHFTNVGQYSYEEEDYLFPNYPYNSLYEDPLFATSLPKPGSGYSFNRAIKPYDNGIGKDRFTFHSPDTHFGRIENVDTGFLKLESIDYGEGKGHFTKIKNNAEYKFITQNATSASAALAAAVAFDLKSGKAKFNGSDFASMYTNMNDLFNKLVAFKNYGYNINSIAHFNKSLPVPNTGDKIRAINYGSYLVNGFNTVEDGRILNNKSRESSLYINTELPLRYAHEYSDFTQTIPRDDSRFIGSFTKDRSEDELTEEDYFQLFRLKYIYSGIAIGMGVYAAADDISNGDNNLTKVLMGIIAQILGDFIDSNDLNGLKRLQDVGDECISDIDVSTMPNYNYTFPQGTFTFPTNQIISVYNYSGESWGEDMHAQGYGIPPEWHAGLGIPLGYPNWVVTNVLNNVASNQIIQLHVMYDELELDMAQTKSVETWAQNEGIPDHYKDRVVGDYLNYFLGYHSAKNNGYRQEGVCGNDILEAVYKAFEYAMRYYDSVSFESMREGNLSRPRTFDVNAYYGSVKADLPAQWGRVYSYTSVDTGFYQSLDERYNSFPTIFGGDTFINKFSFKTKLSVYDYTTVNQLDQADLSLDEMGSLGYPMFWISTKPLSGTFTFNPSDIQAALQGIGATFKTRVVANLAVTIGSVLMQAGGWIITLTGATGAGAVVGVVVAAVGAVVTVLGNVFTNKSAPIEKAGIKLFKQLIEQIINNLGIKNINLDMQRDIGILTHGVIYQYVYGIPTYFVESQVNVDYRQATNDDEGNFYPRVGEDIPDDWLQEDRVPIIHDNNYTYNKTFSKQNRESFFTHLREDYDLDKACNTEHLNRAFWSEKSNLNETLDNWLIYKPLSYHDFPKSYGELTSLDGIQNRQVIARFQNKTQLYNALTTIDTTTFQAYLGNDQLFKSTPPLDLSETDNGSLGSQHRFILKTPHGVVFTDSKRGQVILLQGTNTIVLSDTGMSKWFDQNLKFFSSNPDNDNHFNGLGIHGVYDEFYDRLIITKLDRTPQVNKSWTISYSFKTQSWTSWHSYLPNYYVGDSDYFHSGRDNTFWNHNLDYTKYTTYYGTKYPYIVEYPFVYDAEDEVVQSIHDYTSALVYEDVETYYEPNEIIYFNRALIYNRQQTTGTLNLIPKPEGSLRAYMTYPKYNVDSKDILVSKKGSYYRFNDIRDITKVKGQKIIMSSEDPTRSNIQLNKDNLIFGKRSFNQALIRSKDSRVRLILDNRHDIKLISRVLLQQNQSSQI